MRKMMQLLFLLCCIQTATACLQCDRSIQHLHDNFILSASSLPEQIELKKIRDRAIVTYKSTSQERKGVIDPTTLYRAKTEYHSEFKRFLKTEQTGPLSLEAIKIMEKGREILEKHLNAFIRDGLCPNKCGKFNITDPSTADGFLKRRVMDCLSCRYKIYICPSPSSQRDCGEHSVQSEEGGQAVLDCFLPWHRLVLGNPEYHYSWKPRVPETGKLNNRTTKTLVVTDQSFVILNQLHVDNQGIYCCSLQDRIGTVFYRVTFLLTVDPVTHQTHPPLITLDPTLHGNARSQMTEDMMKTLIIIFLVLEVIACFLLIVIFGLMSHDGGGENEPTG